MKNGSEILNKVENMLDDIFEQNEKILRKGANAWKLIDRMEEINEKIAELQCLLSELEKV